MLKLAALAVPIVVVAFVARPASPAPQDRFAAVQIKTTEVVDGIHMLEGNGGNIGVFVGEDGMLMIDDQYAPLAEKIKAALAELGEGAPKYLVNTHHHGDHTGGNEVFGQSATVVAHDNVRKRLKAQQPALAEHALPDLTYAEGMTLHFNGETVQLLHHAGCHTDGDTVILFEDSKVAHLGDLFFSGMFPYVDVDSGGNVQNAMNAIEELCDTLPEDVKIIPGHGPLSTLDDLRDTLDMYQATTAHVRAAVADGKTTREIQRAGLPPEWRDWAWNFINADRWIDIIVRSDAAR